MKNIRRKVFETNSSSSHSICIDENSDGIFETIVPDEDGIIHLTGGRFGWEWEQYNDALTKANYLAVYTHDAEKDNPRQSQLKGMLVALIKEHTGAKDVSFDFDDNDSYIDHQSAFLEEGMAIEAFYTPDTLKNFLFNPKSYLRTGNDNEDAPPW